MKHTFVLINWIIKLSASFPRDLYTSQNAKLADKYTKEMNTCITSLEKLITAHSLDVHLQKLKSCPDPKIADWEKHVEDTLLKLQNLLSNLRTDLVAIEQVIIKACEGGFPPGNMVLSKKMWQDVLADLSMGIMMAGFMDIETEMAHLRQIAVFEQSHLVEILGDKKLVDDILRNLIPVEKVLE